MMVMVMVMVMMVVMVMVAAVVVGTAVVVAMISFCRLSRCCRLYIIAVVFLVAIARQFMLSNDRRAVIQCSKRVIKRFSLVHVTLVLLVYLFLGRSNSLRKNVWSQTETFPTSTNYCFRTHAVVRVYVFGRGALTWNASFCSYLAHT